MAVKKAEVGEVVIDTLKTGMVRARIIGRTPLYMNSMSAKTKRTLMLGGGKKTAAEKKELKHQPYEEFADSLYRIGAGPTALCFPAPGIKAAMATAALETAGITKTSVQRLIFLPQQSVPIWGLPYLKMDVVRSADMARTPDVRTRGFLPRWCAEIDITFTQPTLSYKGILSLLSNAGIIVGIGDFRQEKGRGSFGTFNVGTDQSEGDFLEEWNEIVAEGRTAQLTAMKNPTPVPDDYETESLLQMFDEALNSRQAA